MKTIELVPKKRRVWRCDQCGDTEGVREYLLPYGAGGKTGRYRDLCQCCQRAIQRQGGNYITRDTDLVRTRFASRQQDGS